MALDVKAVYLIKKINCILSYYRWIMETWTDLLISTFCGGNRLPYKTHYFPILTVTLMSIHIQHINVIFFIHNLTQCLDTKFLQMLDELFLSHLASIITLPYSFSNFIIFLKKLLGNLYMNHNFVEMIYGSYRE
jgi:hypothetical protein